MENERHNMEQDSKNHVQVAWRALSLLVLATILFLAAGCEKKEPSVNQKFVNTYVELLVAESMYGQNNPTSMVKRQTILKDSGYTRSSFLKEANAILDDRDMWVPFEKAVIARLDSLAEEVERSREKAKSRKQREE